MESVDREQGKPTLVKSGKDEQNWKTWMKSGSNEHKIPEARQVLRIDRKDKNTKEGQRNQKYIDK